MARRRWRLALGVTLGALTALSAQVARADAIDGNWCSAQGNYSRHNFTYQVPASDPGAGKTVYMALLNENTVHLTMAADAQSAQQSPVEVWHRCPPAVSSRLVPRTESGGRERRASPQQ